MGLFHSKRLDKEALFKEAFDTTKQIKAILTNLHSVLCESTQDSSVEIVLARIKDNVLDGWEEFVPDHLFLVPELLDRTLRGMTLFSYTAKTGIPQRISDIERHLHTHRGDNRVYLPTKTTKDNRGSILCYPIICGGKVRYVLSIRSHIPGVFSRNFAERFEIVAKAFTELISMEYHLRHVMGHAK